MFSISLSTAFQHAHDSSREDSPLPVQLAFYILLSKLGFALLSETSFIRFKNTCTEVLLLSVFIISVWHYRHLFVSEESNLKRQIWYEETDFRSYKFLCCSQLEREGVSIIFLSQSNLLRSQCLSPSRSCGHLQSDTCDDSKGSFFCEHLLVSGKHFKEFRKL